MCYKIIMQCYIPIIIDKVYRPCGKCYSCRSNKASDWAYRLQHEALDHTDITFLTLTYNEPTLESLKIRYPYLSDLKIWRKEMSLYIRSLRRHSGLSLRYFGVSQHGDQSGRLHYHMIIYGVAPDNPALERAWQVSAGREILPKGFIDAKKYHPKNSHYVARYIARYYSDEPEALVCSRKPIIGHSVAKKQKKSMMLYMLRKAKFKNYKSPTTISFSRSYQNFNKKNDYIYTNILERYQRINSTRNSIVYIDETMSQQRRDAQLFGYYNHAYAAADCVCKKNKGGLITPYMLVGPPPWPFN